ncbi:hypothetical protein HPP92_001160 [Vanilla planifolia]|uniref:J domain-containing protein n=1 Tax=Vanilla planifolia TaxID=51239 RepID=A0A835RVS2_VANPL|nr:hypothetical protein HPP92_001160 [Vanilla planifolia]
MMDTSQCLRWEQKHWWTKNRKLLHKHICEARSLIATQDPRDVAAAVGVLDAALSLSPRLEVALELKARSLLFLRRFRDIADMLQDYIPSYRISVAVGDDSSSNSLSSSGSGGASTDVRERAKLLHVEEDGNRSFRCFSISDLKRKVVAGLQRGSGSEAQWRYVILGQACYHLGLLEDAMLLLQTGRHLASAVFRRESVSRSDDIFAFPTALPSSAANSGSTFGQSVSESQSAAHLLTHIKLLLRRRAAANAALDAGLPIEAARHFSKILEGKRGTPHPFAATCLVGRATAFSDGGRVADAIADCNRALALDPTYIPALQTRANLLESVRCLSDCLRDLDHLKLLYDAIVRDRKLPGPPWRPSLRGIIHGDVPERLRNLAERIPAIRQRVASGEGNNIDYYKLIGVRRGCARSDLERAHLLLSLRHKPDRAGAFMERLEFADEHRDLDAVKDQMRMSASILYRWLQKGYACIMAAVLEELAAEKQRAAMVSAVEKQVQVAPVYQGVFCRDMAKVGSMLSRGIQVKYEALSC